MTGMRRRPLDELERDRDLFADRLRKACEAWIETPTPETAEGILAAERDWAAAFAEWARSTRAARELAPRESAASARPDDGTFDDAC